MWTKKMLTSVPAGGVTDTPSCELDKPLHVKTAPASFLIWA
jgi:hypothetical protein